MVSGPALALPCCSLLPRALCSYDSNREDVIESIDPNAANAASRRAIYDAALKVAAEAMALFSKLEDEQSSQQAKQTSALLKKAKANEKTKDRQGHDDLRNAAAAMIVMYQKLREDKIKAAAAPLGISPSLETLKSDAEAATASLQGLMPKEKAASKVGWFKAGGAAAEGAAAEGAAPKSGWFKPGAEAEGAAQPLVVVEPQVSDCIQGTNDDFNPPQLEVDPVNLEVAPCGIGGQGEFTLSVNKISSGGTEKVSIQVLLCPAVMQVLTWQLQVSPMDLVADVINRLEPAFEADLRHVSAHSSAAYFQERAAGILLLALMFCPLASL